MTLQQQAYGLIDRLSDDSVQVVIQVMERMLPQEEKAATVKDPEVVSSKMKAYLRIQELRKETSEYDISEFQREAALDEKYGTFA